MENTTIQQQTEQPSNLFDKILEFLFGSMAALVLMSGEWKSGKTDFALLIVERLLQLGIVKEAASNIQSVEDSRVTFVGDMPHLKMWLYRNRTSKLYIFDEGGSHLHKRQSMSRKNVAVMTLLPEISKANAKVIILFQNPESIDGELTNQAWCRGIIHKLNKKTVRFSSVKFPGSQKMFVFSDVPRTSIKFDPMELAQFNLVAPLDATAFQSDETKKLLWDWAVNEKTAKDLDKHPQQINRIVRRFVKEVLVAQNETSKPIHK